LASWCLSRLVSLPDPSSPLSHSLLLHYFNKGMSPPCAHPNVPREAQGLQRLVNSPVFANQVTILWHDSPLPHKVAMNPHQVATAWLAGTLGWRDWGLTIADQKSIRCALLQESPVPSQPHDQLNALSHRQESVENLPLN
jgi:hypothetical protein